MRKLLLFCQWKWNLDVNGIWSLDGLDFGYVNALVHVISLHGPLHLGAAGCVVDDDTVIDLMAFSVLVD